MSPTLRAARVLAALRELAVEIDFGWRDWSCFRARPYDWSVDVKIEGREREVESLVAVLADSMALAQLNRPAPNPRSRGEVMAIKQNTPEERRAYRQFIAANRSPNRRMP